MGFLVHPSVDRHGIDASRYRSLDRSCVVVNRRAVRVHRIPSQKGWRLGLEASLSVLLVGFSCAELDDHPARKEVSILAGGILHQSSYGDETQKSSSPNYGCSTNISISQVLACIISLLKAVV